MVIVCYNSLLTTEANAKSMPFTLLCQIVSVADLAAFWPHDEAVQGIQQVDTPHTGNNKMACFASRKRQEST
jgi:hypothetical protein